MRTVEITPDGLSHIKLNLIKKVKKKMPKHF